MSRTSTLIEDVATASTNTMIPNLATDIPAAPRDVEPKLLVADRDASQQTHASGNQAEHQNLLASANAHITRCIERGEAYLYLGALKLPALPPVIWHMPQLRHLHIGGNLLKSIPADIGWLSELTHLTAGGNEITEVSGALGCLTRLEVLDLSDNHLTSLPAELANLRSLRYLYIRGNPFHQLPPVLALLPQGCSVLISPLQDGTKLEHCQPLFNPHRPTRGPVIMIDDNPGRFWPHPRFLG